MGGPIGILIIIGLAMAVAKLGIWSMMEGVVIGASISVASTMVLARLLSDSGKLETTFGRVIIAITFVFDIAERFYRSRYAGMAWTKVSFYSRCRRIDLDLSRERTLVSVIPNSGIVDKSPWQMKEQSARLTKRALEALWCPRYENPRTGLR